VIDRDIRQGFFTLDSRRGAHCIFAGHPVLTDNPNVRMAVFSDGKSEVRATLNNAGDVPVSLTVRPNPALGPAAPQRLDLSAGEIKEAKVTLPEKGCFKGGCVATVKFMADRCNP
jgi:hypothetical protein